MSDFQFSLWGKLEKKLNVSISAPTSAGKSFILQEYLKKLVSSTAASNVAFIVPTRALINQVAGDLSVWLGEGSEYGDLITTPLSKDIHLPTKGVYVLTQERLQLLFEAHKELSLDLIIIDEAQSIGDGPRGVLLSSIIELTLSRNPSCQVLFSGPNIMNPEKLGEIFGLTLTPEWTSGKTVKQNIIFLDCDSTRQGLVNISFLMNNEKIELGKVNVDQPLFEHKDKLVHLPLKFGKDGQNLIYAMGQAECEDIAFKLADGETVSIDPELKDLSDLAKESVHPQFQLANTVLSGVGFHYGHIPALLRKNIEDTYSKGKLKFLVTTSTLLYGVNLPARNLFMHNPRRGKDNPISSIDFWNLAGRAGRLGKEFEGNIYLVDYGEWPTSPMEGEKERSVTPTLLQHVSNNSDNLIRYIKDPNVVPDRDRQDEFENTFVKLYNDFRSGRINRTLSRLGVEKNDDRYFKLIQALEEVEKSTSLPNEVFEASPTVSIHRQNALYERLKASLNKEGPEYIIPKHPLDRNAYASLLATFKRCHSEILKIDKIDKSHVYFVTIALRWMKGDPLPQIVTAGYELKKKRGQNPNMATVIRNTLTEIEQQLRFRYVRLMSCYNAVLHFVLEESGLGEYLQHIPAIPLYLEVGACSSTMISFMNLGLSRFTAGKLRQLPRRADMDLDEARSWIKSQNIDSLDLPQASIREINEFIH